MTRPLIKMVLEILLAFFSFVLVGLLLEHYGMTRSTARQITSIAFVLVCPFIISSFMTTAKKRQDGATEASDE